VINEQPRRRSPNPSEIEERWMLEPSDPEVVQEPTDQPHGMRDCAFRDPAGNMIRIQELR